MRHLLLILLLLIPGVALAQSVQDQIVSQLTAQGFTRIEVSRTLLGRVKIEARSNSLDRELVFNPVTGEILRDYWRNRSDGGSSPRVLIPNVGDRNEDRSGNRVDTSDRAELDQRDDRSDKDSDDDSANDRSDDDRSDRSDDRSDRSDDRSDRDDDRSDRDDDDDDDREDD